MNLDENSELVVNSQLKDTIERVKTLVEVEVVSISPGKYINRLEIDFKYPISCEKFLAISLGFLATGGFVVENVRWKRFDTYLAVVGATFVAFKPVED